MRSLTNFLPESLFGIRLCAGDRVNAMHDQFYVRNASPIKNHKNKLTNGTCTVQFTGNKFIAEFHDDDDNIMIKVKICSDAYNVILSVASPPPPLSSTQPHDRMCTTFTHCLWAVRVYDSAFNEREESGCFGICAHRSLMLRIMSVCVPECVQYINFVYHKILMGLPFSRKSMRSGECF